MKYLFLTFTLLLAACTVFAKPPKTVELNTAIEQPEDPASPVGIWQFGGDGAIFEIKAQPGRKGVFDLYMLDSPDLSAPSDVRFGSMEATGVDNNYDVVLYESLKPARSSASVSKKKNFIFKFSLPEGTVTITEYKEGPRINFRRWIPYFFRVGVERTASRPSGIDGARRISPPTIKYPVVL